MERVLFVCRTLANGGAERVVSVLCSSLAEMGVSVDLLLYSREKNEYRIDNRVRISEISQKRHGEKNIEYQVRRLSYIRKYIKTVKPDVIIPFLPSQVLHSYIASRGLGIPFVVTVRNNPQYDTGSKRMRILRNFIAVQAEAIFLQTADQRAYFDKRKLGNKCFVIPNPVQSEIMKSLKVSHNEIKQFVSVGRLVSQKNFKLLIEAFVNAHEKHKEIRLDIFGEGVLRQELLNFIKENNAENYIFLRGHVDNIAERLQHYDAFVMSSDYEGMPNALMEAMGSGLFCISTNCQTGTEELIGKQNERGILVPVGDVKSLAAAIDEAIGFDEEIVHKMVSGRNFIRENYSPNVIANRLIEELDRIIYESKNKRILE